MLDLTLEHYEDRYAAMREIPEWRKRICIAECAVLNNERLYRRVAMDAGVPWEFIGLLHLMEAGCNTKRQILNGQHFDAVTTIAPLGQGPWDTWEDAALEPLAKLRGMPGAPGMIAMELERWNGLGYAKREMNSPYLWSGSNLGVGVGKFVGDGKYDPRAVSEQVGGMVVLRRLRFRNLG